MSMDSYRRSVRFILVAAACAAAAGGCGGSSDGFEPSPGVSGAVHLQNQADHSGVLVRIVGLEGVAVTDSAGVFSFADIPDGRWRVEAGYPYFDVDNAEVEVRDGLQRNAVRFRPRQLLRFWIELPDTFVSFCKCEQSLEFDMSGYVENLTGGEVTVACGSTPLTDFAIVSEVEPILGRSAGPVSARERLGAYDPCAAYGMILPGELDMPGSVTLEPRETRVFVIPVRLLSECYEDGRYSAFWALVDCSNHPGHYVYDEPQLNRTLLKKRGLLTPSSIRLIESSAD